MAGLISIFFYIFVFWGVISAIKKRSAGKSGPAGSATGTYGSGRTGSGDGMGGIYESYSGSRTHNAASGSMPHKHETSKYHNMAPGTIPHSHQEKKYHNTESGSMFRKRESGKFHSTESGSMAHDRGTGKYRSMADASQLPPGYILLNGEPVRVADLEGK